MKEDFSNILRVIAKGIRQLSLPKNKPENNKNLKPVKPVSNKTAMFHIIALPDPLHGRLAVLLYICGEK